MHIQRFREKSVLTERNALPALWELTLNGRLYILFY